MQYSSGEYHTILKYELNNRHQRWLTALIETEGSTSSSVEHKRAKDGAAIIINIIVGTLVHAVSVIYAKVRNFGGREAHHGVVSHGSKRVPGPPVMHARHDGAQVCVAALQQGIRQKTSSRVWCTPLGTLNNVTHRYPTLCMNH